MDFNKSNERAIKLNCCINKFKSFGWSCLSVDGHNQNEIKNALDHIHDIPKFIQANTIKGKGCKEMENNPEWHHKSPSSQEHLNEILKNI
jgi:transketolase